MIRLARLVGVVTLFSVSIRATSLSTDDGEELLRLSRVFRDLKSRTHKYFPCRVLGRGSTAVVFEATRAPVDAEVNECDSSPAYTSVALKCFVRERLDEVLDSQLTVQVRAVFALKGEPWTLRVMDIMTQPEFECAVFQLGGPSIAKSLGGMPVSTRSRIAIRMIEIVTMLHSEHGLTHGDLHLENWLIMPEEGPAGLKLIDFDLAAWLSQEEDWTEEDLAAIDTDRTMLKACIDRLFGWHPEEHDSETASLLAELMATSHHNIMARIEILRKLERLATTEAAGIQE